MRKWPSPKMGADVGLKDARRKVGHFLFGQAPLGAVHELVHVDQGLGELVLGHLVGIAHRQVGQQGRIVGRDGGDHLVIDLAIAAGILGHHGDAPLVGLR